MGTIYRNGTAFIGSGGAGGVELTQAEYDALPTTEKMNGSIYFISDGEASYPSASTMRYDNTTSGLAATSVQDAVDEVNDKVNDNAGDIAELNNGLTNIHAFNNPRIISSGQDLNDYKGTDKAGVFYVNGTTSTIANTPANYCALYVMSSGTPTFQFAFTKSEFYFRAHTGSPASWGEWRRVTSTTV